MLRLNVCLFFLLFSSLLYGQLLPNVEKKPAPKPVVQPAPKPAPKPAQKAVQKPVVAVQQAEQVARKIDLGPGIVVSNEFSYTEDFSRGSGIWNQGKDDEKEWKRENGRLRMIGINDDYSYTMRKKIEKLDTKSDFSFSALVKYVEGKTTQPFGLTYLSGSDQKNYFFISADGGYKLSMKKGDDWVEVTPWKKSSSILSGTSPNLLEVRKRGPMLEFVANGTVLERLPDNIQGQFQNQFGFYNQARHTIEIDNVTIVGKKTSHTVFITADKDGYVFLDRGGVEIQAGFENPIVLPEGTHRLKFISRTDPGIEYISYIRPARGLKVHVDFETFKTLRKQYPSAKISMVPMADASTGRWGFAETNTRKQILPAVFDYVDSVRDGIATVSREGTFYKINAYGQPLLIASDPLQTNAGKIYIDDARENEIVEVGANGAEFNIPKFTGADYSYEEMNWEDPLAYSLLPADLDGDREEDIEYLFDRRRRQFFQEGSTEFGTEGTIKVVLDGKHGFLDTMNRMIIPPMYQNSKEFSKGLCAVRLNDKWGMVDKMNNTVIPFDYGYISARFTNNMIWALKDGDFILLNPTGSMASSKKFDDANGFSEGLCAVEVNGKWGFVDSNINFVIQPKFDSVDFSFSEGIIAAKSGKLWGYIDQTGTWIVPPRYEWYRSFNHGKALVAQKGKWGVINTRGETIMPLIYSYVRTINKPYAAIIAELNGRRMLFDAEGRPLISSPSYETVGYDCHGIFWARDVNSKIHYFDWRGKKLSN